MMAVAVVAEVVVCGVVVVLVGVRVVVVVVVVAVVVGGKLSYALELNAWVLDISFLDVASPNKLN